MCVSSLILSVLLFLSAPVQAQTVDFDGNGTVDLSDFIAFAQAFGSTDSTFDLNADGTVNFPDFLIFARLFGAANPTPEPPPPSLKRLDTIRQIPG